MLPVSSAVYRVASRRGKRAAGDSQNRRDSNDGGSQPHSSEAANLLVWRRWTTVRATASADQEKRARRGERETLSHTDTETHTHAHTKIERQRERERESEGGRAREDAERYLLERERTPEPEVGGLLRPPSVTPTTVHSALMSCTRTCLHHPAKPAPARLRYCTEKVPCALHHSHCRSGKG